MQGMFCQSIFNQPIGDWDVSNVKDMSFIFASSYYFNQPIEDWDVSKVTDMEGMFVDALSFNQPLNKWGKKTGNVTNMGKMFQSAKRFNQPIGDWDVSNVKFMEYMFNEAESFNQPIGDWKVSNVTIMYAMFSHAKSFNQPIGNWDVSKVTNMALMFVDAISFNQDLDNWIVPQNTDVELMFLRATAFESYYPRRGKKRVKAKRIPNDFFDIATGQFVKTNTISSNDKYRPEKMSAPSFEISDYVVPLNAEYFDAFEMENVSIVNAIAENPEIIVIKVTNSLFGFERNSVIQQMKTANYVKYECAAIKSMANVKLDIPYFLFKSLGIPIDGVVPFFDLWCILKSDGQFEKGDRLYEFVATGQKLLTTASHSAYFTNSNTLIENGGIMSMSHCQEGQDEQVFAIKIMHMAKKSNSPKKSPSKTPSRSPSKSPSKSKTKKSRTRRRNRKTKKRQ